MKTGLMIVMALAVAAIVGCSSHQGGSISPGRGFRIAGPAFATDVKQGDRQTVTISLKREKYFKQDVTLQAMASSGIGVEPSKVEVKAGDSPDVLFQIKTARDAALGEYQVHLVATPENGKATSKDLIVRVVAP